MKTKQQNSESAPENRNKREPTVYVGMRLTLSFAKRLQAIADCMGDQSKRSVVEMLDKRSLREVERILGLESPPADNTKTILDLLEERSPKKAAKS